MKRKLLAWGLLGAALICCACGAKTQDLAGTYTDKQGTADIYSQLELTRREDGTYGVVMSLYRIALLEGTAACEDGTLHFICTSPAAEADISISAGTAEVIVIASELPDMAAGSVYRFLDGPAEEGGSTVA